jgi:hypothetical protein
MSGTTIAIAVFEGRPRPKTRQVRALSNLKTDKQVALIPLDHPVSDWRHRVSRARPDASFVTHLIAVAAGTPQTCGLRRAAQTDALADYNFTASRIVGVSAAKGTRISQLA